MASPECEVDIEAWYRRYGESVHRRCLRLCRNPTQALDLVQETFLRAHRYRRSFRAESSPLTWLFTIADRCFFDTLRKKQPIACEDVESFVREEESGAELVFTRHDLVARLLARAPGDVRQIVVFRYFDELELQQIADRLGVNERTVRRKLERFLSRARKFARKGRRD
ncbi:MAG: RNA polymerase sigma factor [Deltaproteobacteria bacterium]|nr:RNA polymerase sigma factor [Deltaproteobacteria bacterium]